MTWDLLLIIGVPLFALWLVLDELSAARSGRRHDVEVDRRVRARRVNSIDRALERMEADALTRARDEVTR